ncbi:MAG: FkbM family methyltransferase [Lachnospiraceae bacterium]|nr:FkbM family methyltransferase [Lachnospiraceae bacterium]
MKDNRFTVKQKFPHTLKFNKYAYKIHTETKELKGIKKYARILGGGGRELVRHNFNLWDYMDELKNNNYIIELEDGIKFYLPYCQYFDTIQMEIARDDDFYDGKNLEYLKEKIIKPGMVILDIGANIGNHTVFFAKKCMAAHVYSIEPQKNVYEILEKNISLNSLDDVCTIYNIALGESLGKADIAFYNRTNCGGTRLTMSDDGDIVMSTLDGMNLPDIDFVKIDVEGFEYNVLKGGEKLLRSMSPILYVEINDENYQKVSALLNSYGYTMTEKVNQGDYLFKKR